MLGAAPTFAVAWLFNAYFCIFYMLAASLPRPPRARSGQPHVLYGENFLSTTGKVSSFSPAVSVGAKRPPLATSALYKRLTSYPLDNSWVLRGLREANVMTP